MRLTMVYLVLLLAISSSAAAARQLQASTCSNNLGPSPFVSAEHLSSAAASGWAGCLSFSGNHRHAEPADRPGDQHRRPDLCRCEYPDATCTDHGRHSQRRGQHVSDALTASARGHQHTDLHSTGARGNQHTDIYSTTTPAPPAPNTEISGSISVQADLGASSPPPTYYTPPSPPPQPSYSAASPAPQTYYTPASPPPQTYYAPASPPPQTYTTPPLSPPPMPVYSTPPTPPVSYVPPPTAYASGAL